MIRLKDIELKPLPKKRKIRQCGKRQKIVGLDPDKGYKVGGTVQQYEIPGHPELLLLELEMDNDD